MLVQSEIELVTKVDRNQPFGSQNQDLWVSGCFCLEIRCLAHPDQVVTYKSIGCVLDNGNSAPELCTGESLHEGRVPAIAEGLPAPPQGVLANHHAATMQLWRGVLLPLYHPSPVPFNPPLPIQEQSETLNQIFIRIPRMTKGE